jgi:anti-anti-sigma factor
MTSGEPEPGAPQPCRVDSEDSGQWCHLTVHGDVDIATAHLLGEAVADALARGRRHVAIDMRSVTFMDSTGLSAILVGRKAALAAGGSLLLTEISSTVQLVLDATNLTDLLVDADAGGDPGRGAPPAT